GRSVRVFGFALTLVVAGTDHGVYSSSDGLTWRPSGLGNTSIGAVAVTAVHDPVRIVAGSDAASTIGGVPLFQSTDGGHTWAQLRAAISGKVISSLAAGPLPPGSLIRPLVVGTNAGLFISINNAASFTPSSGGGLLPSTDYTQIDFVTTHFDRFYAASDGGGSASGGLWRTRDAAHHFASLSPPMRSVTALTVSNDENPILYVATYRPADQVAVLWGYRDTGGIPQGVGATPTPSTSGARTNPPPPAGTSELSQILLSAETPYIAIGLVALIVILMAVVSHFRGRRG
ncbi:MAG: Sortilin, neurotensin receptor 3, partial [Chloroflexota bacterium]|nr:Sortilin, neurotensin receptor 3 [Chloroflexota bacterium]